MGIVTLFRRMGPAWIISAVACGPGTMVSVAAAGAVFGYDLLWVVILSAVLACNCQYLAALLALATQKGLVALTEEKLGRGWAWFVALDAVAATWLAGVVLVKSLVAITGALTGWVTPFWGLLYAVLLYLLFRAGGAPGLERLCKFLVLLIVASFLVAVVAVRPDPLATLGGLWPALPGGFEASFIAAGIMGGAVHITILVMQSYNLLARRWTLADRKLAWWDNFLSMGLAYGFYATAIFLAGAAVLHPLGITPRGALDLAQALAPALGRYANAAFLIGTYGAIFSTVAPLFVATAYFLADKLGWPRERSDPRLRRMVAAGCLVGALGPFWNSEFVSPLVLMLALGLVGTVPLLVILLRLAARPEIAPLARPGRLVTGLGWASVAVTAYIALAYLGRGLGLV